MGRYLLRVHDILLSRPHNLGNGVRAEHIPVIFVSDAGASWPTLLRAIAEFASIPVTRSSSGTDTLRQLRTVLPRLGTRMIVVDDAHMLRRVSTARDLTDNLKMTLDALPVSFVFAGAGLEHSALLKRTDHSEDEYSAAVQLAGRMYRRELDAFSNDDPLQMRAWHRRIGTLIKRIELIDGLDSTAMRSSTFTGNLFHLSGGRTGMSLELLKDTTIAAIGGHRSPTVADLISESKRRGPSDTDPGRSTSRRVARFLARTPRGSQRLPATTDHGPQRCSQSRQSSAVVPQHRRPHPPSNRRQHGDEP